MEWEVGQEVWVVPNYNGRPRALKIGRIARKWVYFDPEFYGRFEKETGDIDGGRDYTSVGKVWKDKETWEEHRRLNDKWISVRRAMPHSVPKHLTDFDLDLISDLIAGRAKQ